MRSTESALSARTRDFVLAKLGELRMEQVDLAERMGVSESTVSTLLARKRGANLGMLRRMVIALDPGAATRDEPATALLCTAALIAAVGEAGQPSDSAAERAIAQVRAEVRQLAQASKFADLYQWGSAGDPREGSAEPIGYQQIPPGRETVVGPRGFAVRVRGESMVRRRIRDGDVVFINPDRPWGIGSVVLARVETADETGMVVKEVAMDGQGRTILRSALADGSGAPVSGSQYTVIGPVVLKVSVDDFVNGHAAAGAA